MRVCISGCGVVVGGFSFVRFEFRVVGVGRFVDRRGVLWEMCWRRGGLIGRDWGR